MIRRRFLGLFGGAVVAGPKLAQQIADADVAGRHVAMLGSAGATLQRGGPADDSWIPYRIAELRRLLSGKRTYDEEQRRRALKLAAASAVERFRLDGLRSVSPQHKMRMLVEETADRDDRQQSIYMALELAQRLKQGA